MVNLTDNIIELNRDTEPLIVQAQAIQRSFKIVKPEEYKYKPLQFVHLSDIHAVMDLWNRMVEYVNHYKDYIDFALHTGDYCGNNQMLYADFYNYGTQCDRPIFNCVGNHDSVVSRKWITNDKAEAYNRLFAPINDDSANAEFMDCEYSMTYYKDFPESNIRLIVLDLYYDIEIQQKWLKETLNDAKEKGLCVITAMHEPSDEVNNTFDVTFHTYNKYIEICGRNSKMPYEDIIADFKDGGGCHIVNLAGHVHHDLFGFTDRGVLNSTVPSATNWDGWCDGARIKGTRTYDCFNVVAIDVNLGLLKITRVGNNRDQFLRSQKALCYDYINKKIVYND